MGQAASTASSSRRVPIHAAEAQLAITEAVGRRRAIYPTEATGYVCAYSEIILEVDKVEHRRGDYASFDHAVPNRGERADMCSRIVNDLKAWMTDAEFRQFVCDVLDPTALRRLHGLDEQISREFLVGLRTVMRKEGSPEELAAARVRLKDLSARFRY